MAGNTTTFGQKDGNNRSTIPSPNPNNNSIVEVMAGDRQKEGDIGGRNGPSPRVAFNDAMSPSLSQQSKPELRSTDPDVKEQLAFSLPFRTKWAYLAIIFLVQVSMNFNTTLYSNGLRGISGEFGVSEGDARWGAAAFLIAYAFGCELWAPWSEEYGRWIILQMSLGLVNVFGILVALAPSFKAVIIGRIFGGLMTAGGSVTLAVIADLFHHDDPWFQYATLFIVASSVGGSILGPLVGAPIEMYLNWRWCMWIQVIFGGVVQLLHLIFVRETRATVLLDRIARRRRSLGTDVYGPGELSDKRIDWREIATIWMRPFRFFLTEPIVLALSLLSGFSDALIFMFIQSFAFIYPQEWGFGTLAMSATFLPLLVGYVISYLTFLPAIRRNIHARQRDPTNQHALYEDRLWWLLYTAPGLPIGLLIFAFTTHASMHWIGSMVATGLIGITNFAIYMATIDYMLRAYGPYAASATGGNGWARDFLAGVLTPCAVPMYHDLGTFKATIILFAISCALTVGVYFTYYYGPILRERSKFAQTLAEEEKRTPDGLVDFIPDLPGSKAGSRRGTPAGSRTTSPTRPATQRKKSTGPAGTEPGRLSVPPQTHTKA
ncbi:hypothetical protein SLS62_010163 [Diatrype stigma]|uniref:Major facilitator superfamily (MFS) profile domain-containing protein n=1 Tax=Diatrype stigma TaxID=117547 RepID=A0AAN9YGY5_9PEZI